MKAHQVSRCNQSKNQPPITVPPKSQSISIVSETIGPCAVLMKQSTSLWFWDHLREQWIEKQTKWKQGMVVKDVCVCVCACANWFLCMCDY